MKVPLNTTTKRFIQRKTSTLISTQQIGRYGSNHWFRLNLDLQQKHIPVEPMHAIKVSNIPTSNLSTK
jgi:hypothetical protein